MSKLIKRYHDQLWKIYYFAIGLLGLILMIFQIEIYRHTMINVYIPIAIILFSSTVAFYIGKNRCESIYPASGKIIIYVQYMISWGCIFCYIFMACNYYLADQTITKHKVDIIKKGSLPGPKRNRMKRSPTVKIDYFNFEKELVFSYPDIDRIHKAESVIISIKKGYLGFDVIDNYDIR